MTRTNQVPRMTYLQRIVLYASAYGREGWPAWTDVADVFRESLTVNEWAATIVELRNKVEPNLEVNSRRQRSDRLAFRCFTSDAAFRDMVMRQARHNSVSGRELNSHIETWYKRRTHLRPSPAAAAHAAAAAAVVLQHSHH